MTYFFLFIFGLIFGSFLNVVSLRYKDGENVFNLKALSGRSHCPVCRKNLFWYELIPVLSFIIQKAKCRHCGHKISLQYPLVEILSGLIFVCVPLALMKNFQISTLNFFTQASNYQIIIIAIWVLIFLFLLLLSSIDFRLYIIPDSLNILLGILGVALAFISQKIGAFGDFSGSFLGPYSFIFGFRESIWANHIIAMFLGAGFFAAIILLTKGKAMGWGDVKLAAALGIIFGWPDITMVLAISFIVGAIFGIGLVLTGRKKMKGAVPFGPFLAIGSAVTFLFGPQLVELYLKLLAI